MLIQWVCENITQITNKNYLFYKPVYNEPISLVNILF